MAKGKHAKKIGRAPKVPSQVCECEHVSHFASPRSAHVYGAKRLSARRRGVRPNFHYCDVCAEEHIMTPTINWLSGDDVGELR